MNNVVVKFWVLKSISNKIDIFLQFLFTCSSRLQL